MFLVILATASFTALVISWGVALTLLHFIGKSQRNTLKHIGICPDCGQALPNRTSGKDAMGFHTVGKKDG